MNIRPPDPDPARRISASGTEATPAPPALKRQAETPASPAAAPADRAELSNAARELSERLAAPSAAPTSLSPERMRTVLARIRDGHYDLAPVLDQVARKLQAEFPDTGSDR
jgi:hypothetical protein